MGGFSGEEMLFLVCQPWDEVAVFRGLGYKRAAKEDVLFVDEIVFPAEG